MSRPKAGDILQLDLGDGQKGYVQVSEAGLLIAFDVMTPADLAPEVLKDLDVVFAVHVRDDDLHRERWPVIGHMDVPGDLKGHPLMFRQDASTGRLSIEHPGLPGGEKAATLKECIGLERATVWSAAAVEERLRDHFAGRENRWLRELAIDLQRVPEDQLR